MKNYWLRKDFIINYKLSKNLENRLEVLPRNDHYYKALQSLIENWLDV